MAGAWRFLAAILLAASLFPLGAAADRGADPIPEVAVADLPEQAHQTIALIRKGGPFPFERDGLVFGNFEKLLPLKEHGYYREYTVQAPGMKSRGAWRIVAGKGGELYYTDDHYQSFRRIKEP